LSASDNPFFVKLGIKPAIIQPMRTYLDCYPCFLRQAIEAARMSGATSTQEKAVVQQTLGLLSQLPEGVTPPAIGAQVHHVVRAVTGNDDPYREVKQTATAGALAMLPALHKLLDSSEDKLETAIRLSIAGNIIDFGPNQDYDLWEVVIRVLSQDFAINDLPQLRQRLETASSILFLGDNAGETVFDRFLIETLPLPVTYVVRGGPVINDATYEDAVTAGIDHVANIIDNGTRIPGTIVSECSSTFQAHFNTADIILAKGMGNYETLSTTSRPVFFLLQVKCPVIARDIGAPYKSIVIKHAAEIKN
jgi:damage-control phosphatase, subfamily I